MNISRARALLIPDALQALDCTPFIPIIEKIQTMARPHFLATMNALSQCLEDDEIYLEVGTFRGGSLVGVLLNNSVKAVAIDNFSQFPVDYAQLELGLMLFGVNERVEFSEMDFHEYFKRGDIPKIGLYYYDGAHDEQSTLDGLELVFPYIVQNGIIVLDDTLDLTVCMGINRFLGLHPAEVKILFAVSPAEEYHPSWWQGTIFLQKLSA